MLLSPAAFALGRFSIGPELGFVFQTHRDPTGSSFQGAPAVQFGVSGIYQFDRELSRLALDYAIGFLQTSKLTYRDIKIEGATGSFREKVTAFYWLFGGRYYFGEHKWRPYAGLDVGLHYFRRSSVSYRDRFNAALPNPPVTNHVNMSLVPQIGIEYRPTFRWAVGLAIRPVLSFRSAGIVPAVHVPLTVQIAF